MGITNGELALITPVLVLGSSISGYFFAGVNEAKRDERAREREVGARKELEEATRARSWHEFQLTSMLELQDAIVELARATGRILLSDEKTLEIQGKYYQIPVELNEHADVARRNLIRLLHRITNEDLRAELENFNNRTANMVMSGRTSEEIDVQSHLQSIISFEAELANMFGVVNGELGLHLRALLEWKLIN